MTIPNNVWIGAVQRYGRWIGAQQDNTTADYLSNFANRKEIRYGTEIPASDLPGFPKLLEFTDTDIAAELSSNNGICITLANGVTPVPLGLYPSADLATGYFLGRAKFDLDSGASAGDVLGYIYYDSTQTTVEDKPGVVTDGYVLFMPLEEDPSGTAPQILDWVTDTNLGTSGGSMTSGDLVTGQVGKGLDFDGSNDYVSMPYPIASMPVTLECHAKPTSSLSNARLLTVNSTGTLDQLHSLFVDGSGYSDAQSYTSAGPIDRGVIGTHIGSGTWKGIAATFETSVAHLYMNGASDGTTSSSFSSGTALTSVQIGRNDWGPGEYANSAIDEVRISSVARSADWLAYAYTDDFDNVDTFTLGDLEVSSATYVTTDTTTQGQWIGVYGADGYYIPPGLSTAGLVTSAASYVSGFYVDSSAGAAALYLFGNGSNTAYLQDPVAPTGTRYAPTWYDSGTDWIEIQFFLGDYFTPYRVAVYFYDDGSSRAQDIDVTDWYGNTLDSRSVSSFGGGKWIVWDMAGHIRIRITKTAGSNPVAVAVMFMPVPGGGPTSYTRSCSDAPQASGVVTRAFSGSRTLTDAPQTTGAISRLLLALRAASESPSSSQAAVQSQVSVRSATDAPTSSEAATRGFSGFRTTTDSPQTSDSASINGPAVRTASESPNTSESVTRTFVGARATTDAPISSEAVSRLLVGSRTTTDAPHTSDVAAQSHASVRSASDTPTTSDLVTRAFVGVRSTTDHPQTSESIAFTAGTVITTADAPQVADVVTRAFIGSRAAADSPVTADTVSRAVVTARSSADAPMTADTTARTVGITKTATDAPQTLDAATKNTASVRSTTESPQASVSAIMSGSFFRSLIDGTILSDIITAVSSAGSKAMYFFQRFVIGRRQ